MINAHPGQRSKHVISLEYTFTLRPDHRDIDWYIFRRLHRDSHSRLGFRNRRRRLLGRVNTQVVLRIHHEGWVGRVASCILARQLALDLCIRGKYVGLMKDTMDYLCGEGRFRNIRVPSNVYFRTGIGYQGVSDVL